jgi:hypothetical protein
VSGMLEEIQMLDDWMVARYWLLVAGFLTSDL